MAAEVRATVEPGRHVHLVLEHDGNVADHLRQGFDAQWNDDAHHVLHVLLTGEADGYYADYADRPGRAPGALPRRRLRLPGRALGLSQGRAARHAQRRSAAHRLRAVPAEPRPGRQSAVRRPAGRARRSPQRSRPRSPCSSSARRSRCSSWARRAPAARPSSSSPTITASSPRRCAKADAASSPPSRASTTARPPTRSPIPTRSRPSRAAAPLADDADRRALYRRLLTLRAAALAPHLAGARSISAKAAGPACVAARWRLGNGAVLALVSNLGRDDCAVDPPKGDLLFESRAGASEDVRAGRLMAPATVAFLDPAAKSSG